MRQNFVWLDFDLNALFSYFLLLFFINFKLLQLTSDTLLNWLNFYLFYFNVYSVRQRIANNYCHFYEKLSITSLICHNNPKILITFLSFFSLHNYFLLNVILREEQHVVTAPFSAPVSRLTLRAIFLLLFSFLSLWVLCALSWIFMITHHLLF